MLAGATTAQMNTYELGREQVNAAGGMNVGGTKRKVEFVTYDDQSKPEQAVRIYEKLITDDKVDPLVEVGRTGPGRVDLGMQGVEGDHPTEGVCEQSGHRAPDEARPAGHQAYR